MVAIKNEELKIKNEKRKRKIFRKEKLGRI
jgi:hypothetical protein